MEYSGHYNLVEAPSVHFYALYKNDKGENLPISYTYSEAKTICAYHGLQLSSTTKEVNKEHLALFAYDRISQSEHGLYWNMTQSNGYQLTETRGQIICQVPRTYKGIKLWSNSLREIFKFNLGTQSEMKWKIAIIYQQEQDSSMRSLSF